ncbi:accessory Sec system translocase SecA2 [Bacillus sp. AFS041924]|uniref:accessory Sec system translocase SecA2 n=1 Tax=Bacillus sp. AFS041924 TaxID=2033503 RepID=UPI000BFC64C3|nr:accessory Sec system translocase SecA2 [Bacillus sp. AFS041924]PGS52637.1 accessory Sec system translocase SecA2 [Bacillus sp. AFS041924]
MIQTLQKIIGNRKLKDYEKIVLEINSKESFYEGQTNEALREFTYELKQKIANHEATIQEIKIDAFALVREASKRVLGMRHYDVQLIGGLALLDGNIAEMPTGEGKTLVSSLPAFTRALEEKGVHIITVNEYLARRDAEQIGQIHEFLGLTVGLNIPNLTLEDKKVAYNADITYGIGTEFGFDYLRDNMITSSIEKVQRSYHYAIIDEVDSILIDEAKTPLIIAGKKTAQSHLYSLCARFIHTFKKAIDYLLDEETKAISLTEEGISKIEKAFMIENLFDLEHKTLFHYVHNALRAEVLFQRDVDYIIQEGEIQLIDLFTGRIMEGRSLSNGLHQAIEAKEGLMLTNENHTVASVTIQNYFRMYPILSGMTGTAKTEEKEFLQVYNMEVIRIPTNKSVIRIDHEDIVFQNTGQKLRAVLDDVKLRHKKGQPILIGTTSIRQSEIVAELLENEAIKFQLLNAKNVEKEAEMIALAGQKGMVTISTNMAGRGTDILLAEGVSELGGLHVIGTERHESERIDLQLKGRAGRQGDAGSSQFYLSLEDELFVRYNPEKLEKLHKNLHVDQFGKVLNSTIQAFVSSTQKLCEGNQSSIREWQLKLDGVANEHRRIIYKLRNQLLQNEIELDWFIIHVEETIVKLVNQFYPKDSTPEDWDPLEGKTVLEQLIPPLRIDVEHFQNEQEIWGHVKEALSVYKSVLRGMEVEKIAELISILRCISLSTIDLYWSEHLEHLQQLIEGIHLRQYQQEDPIRLYEFDGFTLFEHTYNSIQQEISASLASTFQELSCPQGVEEQNVIVD